MEYYWTLFNNSNPSSTTTAVPGQNHNFTPNNAWNSWAAAAAADDSRPDWTYCTPAAAAQSTLSSSSTTCSSSVYCNPDPHLTSLKLGKRHYFEDLTPQPPLGPFTMSKKGRPCAAAPPETAVPICQVEGCEAVLLNAKDYHRRHKVCEVHAKAPKVVVLGIEQRFCQQCSRFHGLAEFDEAKRSCRRRLAGHNERRRKSSQEQTSLARKLYHVNNRESALSLLSQTNYSPWSASTVSSPDLPARCNAALCELIAENRASLLGCRQLINPNHIDENRGHVTLNLMQGPQSAFRLLSAHSHRPSEEDGDADCSELWNPPLGY